MVIKFILYWVIQLTWGIVLTAIGGFITVMLIIFGYKPALRIFRLIGISEQIGEG